MAQRGPQLAVAVVNSPPGASITARRMLSDQKMRDLLVNGFPARFTFRLELWREGNLFDNLDTAATWDVFVTYDAYSKTYQVARRGTRETEVQGPFQTIELAEVALEASLPVQLPTTKPGLYYYNVVLDMQSLSFSDLDELQRWLRGDLQPAVRGKRDPVSVLGRGIGTLFSRMLGGQRRHFEAKSVSFRS